MTDVTLAPTAGITAGGITTAALDAAHVGDIRGALGTIKHGDTAARAGLSAKLKTLLAIVGPGLIVMCGDNDAGAYDAAGKTHGQESWPDLLLEHREHLAGYTGHGDKE